MRTPKCWKHSRILVRALSNALNTCVFSGASKLNPLSVGSDATATCSAERVSLHVLVKMC
jgi:hypothetical protein